MFFGNLIKQSIKNYSSQIDSLKAIIKRSDAIVVGAGAGLSVSAGLTYDGERFKKYFSDFENRYGFHDMYSGGFYPYESLEEYWAFWSRHIYVNRYDLSAGKPYTDLAQILKGKNYFIITTNVDHQFQLAGFDKQRLFYTQGDYGLWQCSSACHSKTYNNEKTVRQMIADQKELHIPTELIPYCPVCGKPMAMNLRCDSSFVEDMGWHAAHNGYEDFIRNHKDAHILFLELGVGENTPIIIKYPFWKMTEKNPNAVYACVNLEEAYCPIDIESQSLCINKDIGIVLEQLLKI